VWDQRYSEPGYVYGTAPNDFLKAEFSRIPAGGNVLCLAEGEGRNAVFLATQGYAVTAVDQSKVGMEKARALAQDRGVTITTQVADLADYNLGKATWDGIISIAAHVPPDVRKSLHQRVADALKPGGVFILEAYTEQQLEMEGTGGPPAAQRHLFMALAQLKDELTGLTFRIGRETERETAEGKYHQGKSAVVQVVAQKPEAHPNTLHTAELAFQSFSHGLARGDWSPFLDLLTDDFAFWFPAGPFKGWNHGREKAKEFFSMVSKVFPDGLTLTVQRVTSNPSTVVFEVRSEGVMMGHPYENQAAISFDIRGDKICGYREYLGVIFQLPQST